MAIQTIITDQIENPFDPNRKQQICRIELFSDGTLDDRAVISMIKTAVAKILLASDEKKLKKAKSSIPSGKRSQP